MKGINQDEFDEIFNQWYNPIRNFIYYKTGDHQSAEDIAQDTFLKLWEKRATIEITTVKQLLYTIATNIFRNRLDHQKVSFKFKASYVQPAATAAPDFDMEMAEFDVKLQRALADLDDKKRTVFLMNRIDEFTYKEIAEKLSIPVKTVEKRMEKALSYLRKKIEMKL